MSDPRRPGFDVHLQLDPDTQLVLGITVNGKEYALTPKSSTATESHHHEHHAHAQGNPLGISAPDHEGHTLRSKSLLRRQALFGLGTFASLMALQILLSLLAQPDHFEILREHLPWVLYLDLTVVSLVATIGYLRMYRYAQTNHMTSMMIGMTVGMQVGMMTGGVIGAADGYFIGAMVGVVLGTLLGLSTSWCCGPMAITQSLMSAVMGGTMGAMIVTMMPTERLGVFMPLFTGLNLAILVWFTRLFFKDCVIGEHCVLLKPMSFRNMLTTSLITVFSLYGLMTLKPDATPTESDSLADRLNPFHVEKISSKPAKVEPPSEMTCGGSMMKH